MLELQQVSKRFGKKEVLCGISCRIAANLTTCVLGPSGVGKSVLLKLITGLLRPDSGRILIEGEDLFGMSRSKMRAWRNSFGMLFQDGALFDSQTVAENVAFHVQHHGTLTDGELQRRVDEVLELVGLPGCGDLMPDELSGGMRKRVGLARAIVLRPRLLLFDEPNSGLDPLMADTIDQLILEMKERLGITFLIISHDIVGTLRIADVIGLLDGGRLVSYLPREEFVSSSDERVRRFLARDLYRPNWKGTASFLGT